MKFRLAMNGDESIKLTGMKSFGRKTASTVLAESVWSARLGDVLSDYSSTLVKTNFLPMIVSLRPTG